LWPLSRYGTTRVAAGVEETFGTVVEAEGAGLHQAIATATRWPVELDFRDVDGT
jgi:hypothetical protein